MDESDKAALSRGEAILYCACGYESPAFYFADHAYGCTICRAIVFPQPLPFVYAPPKCDQCHSQLGSWHRILVDRMTEDDRSLCPRCKRQSLRMRGLNIRLLFSGIMDSTPEVGQLLHARTRQPQFMFEPFCFWSPRLRRELALNVAITNIAREALRDGHHEFRTVAVTESHLVVEYIRSLSQREWRWYTG